MQHKSQDSIILSLPAVASSTTETPRQTQSGRDGLLWKYARTTNLPAEARSDRDGRVSSYNHSCRLPEWHSRPSSCTQSPDTVYHSPTIETGRIRGTSYSMSRLARDKAKDTLLGCSTYTARSETTTKKQAVIAEEIQFAVQPYMYRSNDRAFAEGFQLLARPTRDQSWKNQSLIAC